MTPGSFQCCLLTGLETAGPNPLSFGKYYVNGIACPEVVESQSFQVFKCHLDTALDNWPRQVGPDDLWRIFPTSNILWSCDLNKCIKSVFHTGGSTALR